VTCATVAVGGKRGIVVVGVSAIFHPNTSVAPLGVVHRNEDALTSRVHIVPEAGSVSFIADALIYPVVLSPRIFALLTVNVSEYKVLKAAVVTLIELIDADVAIRSFRIVNESAVIKLVNPVVPFVSVTVIMESFGGYVTVCIVESF
jgi:hypothetical protein